MRCSGQRVAKRDRVGVKTWGKGSAECNLNEGAVKWEMRDNFLDMGDEFD